MKSYPLFRKESMPAYITVMSVWCIVSFTSAGLLAFIFDSVSFWIALVWAAITAMLGMSIMFVASIVNLRKLTPGFRRLAAGETDPKIPPVWCPVLTAATNAAIELASIEHTSKNKTT